MTDPLRIAAIRRRKEPIIVDIGGGDFLHFDSLVDTTRIALAAKALQPLAKVLQDDTATTGSAALIAQYDEAVSSLRAAMRDMIVPSSLALWDALAEEGALTMAVLSELVTVVRQAAAGMDPTEPPSSTAGSSADGTGSTATPSLTA